MFTSSSSPVPLTGPASARVRRRATVGAASLLLVLSACGSSSTATPTTTAPVTTAAATATTGAAATAAAPATTEAQAVTTVAVAASTATTASKATTTTSSSNAPAAATPAGLTSISVTSTVDQYFVLYMKPNPSLPLELPVSITKGAAGTTVLTDNRGQLPEDRYRVAPFDLKAPGDVDGDGVDDVTEMNDPVNMNPLNPAKGLKANDGAVIIADRATYEAMSYQGTDVARDAYLAGQEVMKFWIVGGNTDHPMVYFMNTNTWKAHPMFASSIGLPGGRAQGTMRGDVVWDPTAIGPDGKAGVYRFAFQENDALPFADVSLAFELLSANMPFLTNNLMYYPLPQAAMPQYLAKDKPQYDASRVPVLLKKG
jgi:hypothetical protein